MSKEITNLNFSYSYNSKTHNTIADKNVKFIQHNLSQDPQKINEDIVDIKSDLTLEEYKKYSSSVTYNSLGKLHHPQNIISEINYHSSLDVKTEEMNYFLLHAATKGNLEDCKKLLLEGAMVNCYGDHKFTPLHLASRGGHVEVISHLLKSGANIKAINKNGNTPLHSAAYGCQILAICILIKNEADLEVKNNDGDTPLHSAAWKDHASAIQTLVNKGSCLEAKNNDGDTPLHLAAWNGCISAIKALTIVGADLEARNNDGNTPLVLAKQKDNELVLNTIIEAYNIEKLSSVIKQSTSIKLVHFTTTELTNRILAKSENLKLILSDYQVQSVSDYEIERCLRTLDGLDSNYQYLDAKQKIDSMAVMLPSNLPLYSLVIFALIPSFLSKCVNVRPNALLQEYNIITRLSCELDLKELFPNLQIINTDHTGFEKYITEAKLTIFTGRPSKANELLGKMKENSMLVVNGAGHNPVVVTETANIDKAVEGSILLKSFNGGQDCAGPDAILVHQNVAEEFISKFHKQFSALRTGSFKDPKSIVGPINRFSELQKFAKVFYDNSKDIIAGGMIDFSNSIVLPTTIVRAIERYPNYQEVFGPVAFIHPYKEDQDLAHYFHDINGQYKANRMYVTVYGHSDFVSTRDDSFAPGESKNVGIVLNNKTIHEIEIGYKAYGGYSFAASGMMKKLSHNQVQKVAMPILIPEVISEYIIKGKNLPLINIPKLSNVHPSIKKDKEIDPIISSFKELATEIFQDNIAFAFVFGSAAKGQLKVLGHDKDDLDTFVCLKKDDSKSVNEYVERLSVLHHKYDLKVDDIFPAEIMTLDKLENVILNLKNFTVSINKLVIGEEFDHMFWAHALTDKKTGFIGDAIIMHKLIKHTLPFIHKWSVQIIEQLKMEDTLPKHLSQKFLGLSKNEVIVKLSKYNPHLIVHLGLNYNDE